MDSTQGTELGDPHAPQPLCTGTSDVSPNPSLLEVTDPQGKRMTPAGRHEGRKLDLCQVREIPQNPDRPNVTHYLPAKLASGTMTQWTI